MRRLYDGGACRFFCLLDGADFVTTFYHAQIGAIESQEFRTSPLPHWLFCFSDAINASQVKEPYEVVGIISYDNPGKYQVLSLGDAIEPLKTKAREIGANGIIIDKSQPIKSGFISTGIYAEARAIRLKNRN
jgi:hypothetical protein